MALIGLGIAAFGGLLMLAQKLPFLQKVGRLPGDVRVERENFSVYFPMTTMVIVSVVLSLILWGLSHLRR